MEYVKHFKVYDQDTTREKNEEIKGFIYVYDPSVYDDLTRTDGDVYLDLDEVDQSKKGKRKKKITMEERRKKIKHLLQLIEETKAYQKEAGLNVKELLDISDETWTHLRKTKFVKWTDENGPQVFIFRGWINEKTKADIIYGLSQRFLISNDFKKYNGCWIYLFGRNAPEMRNCDGCNALLMRGNCYTKIKRRCKCRKKFYCNVKCQKRHWKCGHNKKCIANKRFISELFLWI